MSSPVYELDDKYEYSFYPTTESLFKVAALFWVIRYFFACFFNAFGRNKSYTKAKDIAIHYQCSQIFRNVKSSPNCIDFKTYIPLYIQIVIKHSFQQTISNQFQIHSPSRLQQTEFHCSFGHWVGYLIDQLYHITHLDRSYWFSNPIMYILQSPHSLKIGHHSRFP